MRRDPRAYLWDAREAVRTAQEFVAGVGEEEYLSNRLLRSGVERQLEIAGEALAQLQRHAPETAEKVPDLRSAVALRNILIHGYAKVDDHIIWLTVQNDLPALATTLDRLLRDSQA